MIVLSDLLKGRERKAVEENMKIKKLQKAVGKITVPGDKSISHRSVMFGAICDGVTHIKGFLPGADCMATIDCFRKMGVRIDAEKENVTVYGAGLFGLKKPESVLYTANSGTTTRLMSGILAGQKFDSVVEGDESVAKRPMSRITKPLRLMGAEIEGDFCPMKIHGASLSGIRYVSPVASAQVKSAVILAALYADGETVFEEPEKSRDHTERMLKSMGADIECEKNIVRIQKTEKLAAADIDVPGDISSAAFFMVLAAVTKDSCITMKNVGINPTRTGIIDVLKDMGADIYITNERCAMGEPSADITVRTSQLHGIEMGGKIIPRLIDEIPIIAVAALFAEGTTVIKDAAELKVKETNRIDAVVCELKKCGADIEATADGMIIRGKRPLCGADFAAYKDHRMAMSLAVLAQGIDGECTIDDSECVNISYPGFFEDLYSLDD